MNEADEELAGLVLLGLFKVAVDPFGRSRDGSSEATEVCVCCLLELPPLPLIPQLEERVLEKRQVAGLVAHVIKQLFDQQVRLVAESHQPCRTGNRFSQLLGSRTT